MRGGVASLNKSPANAYTGARDPGSGVMGRGGGVERGPNIDGRSNIDRSLSQSSILLDAMFVDS